MNYFIRQRGSLHSPLFMVEQTQRKAEKLNTFMTVIPG
ncbi:hypothetical protein ADIS_4568 [Lunatimonas lonarensis]|uniref:Uncharacterized protein n=1 Tax=Lunatimonas lonarensis TaxID=1232681 RepID=R7ZLL3_9BACT|nr:hypothetical protein ADIS_4568 [Lunatimonas lonarensis]